MEDPEYLIDGQIEARALTGVYGASGGGKTFVVIDMALSVATGRPWCGRETMQVPVVYVVAEGTAGVKRRVAAWKRHHGLEHAGEAFFVLSAVNLFAGQEVEELIAEIGRRGIQPGLIVFDTLACCFIGGDENSAKDMGLLIAQVRKVQTRLGTAVILVHHTGKPKDFGATTERGSSALRAASDAMIRVDGREARVVIKNDKRKDDAPAEDIEGTLTEVSLGKSKKGKPIKSCVFVMDKVGTPGADSDGLSRGDRQALAALAACHGGEGVRTEEWLKAFQQAGGGSDSTLQRLRRSLEGAGFVERSPEFKKGIYSLTEKGRSVIDQSRPITADSHIQSVSPPLRGDLMAERMTAESEGLGSMQEDPAGAGEVAA